MDAIQILQALSKAADQIGAAVREEVAQSMVQIVRGETEFSLRDRAQLQASVLRLMRAHAEGGVPYAEVVEFIRDTVIQTARNWDGSQAEPRKAEA